MNVYSITAVQYIVMSLAKFPKKGIWSKVCSSTPVICSDKRAYLTASKIFCVLLINSPTCLAILLFNHQACNLVHTLTVGVMFSSL